VIVEVRGVLYPSVKATSEALGVTINDVYSALCRGNMDQLGLGHTRKQAVEIDGLHFPSLGAASRALGFCRSYLRTALISGSDHHKERLRIAVEQYKLNLNKGDLPL